MIARLFTLGLGLGLLPMAVGCGGIAAADPQKQSDKAKSDAPASEPSKQTKAKTQPFEFGDLPANDPLVANAIQARDAVTELEEELLAQIDELRAALASAKADPEALRRSLDDFLELTRAMQRKTAQTSAALGAASDKAAELSRSSRHLASSYKALADLYRKKARDYTEKKLRDQLLGFAKDFDGIASAVPQRLKTLDAVQKKFPALRRKVGEVHAFLTDAAAFLNAHPGLGTDQRERYSTEYESFAVTFSEWIALLDEFRSAIRERAVSKVIRETFERETLARRQLEERQREEEIRLAKLVEEQEQRRLAEETQRLAKERERAAKIEEQLARTPSAPIRTPGFNELPAETTPAMVSVYYTPRIYNVPVCTSKVVYCCPQPCAPRYYIAAQCR